IAAAKTDQGLPKVPEVCVYFEFNLYRGNRVYKNSTQDFDAFKSPNYPSLAEVGVEVKFKSRYIQPYKDTALEVHTSLCTDIGILHIYPGIPESHIRALLSIPSLKALLIKTYGAGNTHDTESFQLALAAAQKRGIAIINVSQCKSGFVEMGKYESSNHLRAVQTISAGDMTFEATLAKAMYLLGKGFTGFTLKEFMEKDLRGELTTLQ
ncbi:MAG: asparaginase domain-containing protein, partial [Schleiferiaceae bacterium]|nr:asparaginase domain-containing protein [Schleiferiaceae bacterium]